LADIIECITNFSEGANKATLKDIASSIESIEGVKLLHQDSGIAANRTVFTFAGPSDQVLEAAFRAAEVAAAKIDMRAHQGKHPRIGALDVCPFVPIKGITYAELDEKVKNFASRLNTELAIPVFLYEESASNDERKNLANHRKGGYEALERRMNSGEWKADFGTEFNPKTGGTVCGVRPFLVAYNINLTTKDLSIAKRIAYSIRASGWPEGVKEPTNPLSPKLEAVKAIGWYISDFDKVQVSINLANYHITPLWKVFENCKKLAKEYGTEVTGSELIGLIPLDAILPCGEFYHNDSKSATKEDLISFSIKGLGLNDIEEFIAEERILEYLL